MSKRYIFLAIILIAFAFGLTQLPDKGQRMPIRPNEMLLKIIDNSRYLTVHAIAKRIIEEDPSIFLVDVRMPDEYEAYHIPGSINIPLEEIVNDKWQDYLDQVGVDIIFYSNGGMYANQAWMLASEMGYSNLYILEGGLNNWFNRIIQPTPPDESAPTEAFEQYAFEQAACKFFGGGNEIVPANTTANKNKVIVRKKTKKAAEGGC